MGGEGIFAVGRIAGVGASSPHTCTGAVKVRLVTSVTLVSLITSFTTSVVSSMSAAEKGEVPSAKMTTSKMLSGPPWVRRRRRREARDSSLMSSEALTWRVLC